MTNLTETFVIVGLEEGSYQGWDLSSNSLNSIKASDRGVTSLYRKHNILISGHRDGSI